MENNKHKIKYHYKNGFIKEEMWFNDVGYIHRDKNPAIIFYYDNRQTEAEIWYNNGYSHRIDGPSETWYETDGSIKYQQWLIKNRDITDDVNDWLLEYNIKLINNRLPREFCILFKLLFL